MEKDLDEIADECTAAVNSVDPTGDPWTKDNTMEPDERAYSPTALEREAARTVRGDDLMGPDGTWRQRDSLAGDGTYRS